MREQGEEVRGYWMVRRSITKELDEGDPRIQEKSPQPVARKREREKVAAGFCHLMLSPAPRPQLHLCPWLPLCGLPLGPYLCSDEFSIIPPHQDTAPGRQSISSGSG